MATLLSCSKTKHSSTTKNLTLSAWDDNLSDEPIPSKHNYLALSGEYKIQNASNHENGALNKSIKEKRNSPLVRFFDRIISLSN